MGLPFSKLLEVLAAKRVNVEIPDLVTADSALYSTTSLGTPPPSGFFYLNNNFGRGSFVNGVDYHQTLTALKSQFPRASLMEWSWPDAGSGSAFAYAYPELIYGGTPYGNPYNSVGPWPAKISAITRMNVTYDLTLGANTNSYNVLLDMYATASPSTTDGSYVAEISFFPHLNDPSNLTNVHTFSFGDASVTKNGTQISVRPCSGGAPRDILAATIDLKEILLYIVSLGWLTGAEYLRGAEFGCEVQVPNAYNSLPHSGSMRVNQLFYDWA